MSRSTVALACIMKNEAHNLGPFLQSVKGCFDEIVLVDTGSTDNTLDFVEKINKKIEEKDNDWLGFPKIRLEHFVWVHDFAKAREYAFSKTTTDYVMWLDLDDRLNGRDGFIKFRDTIMDTAHYWMAQYNYSFDNNGNVTTSFLRERVVKKNFGFRWKFFIHEGIVNVEGREFWPSMINTWAVDHQRTNDDLMRDKGRNLVIFEQQDKSSFEPRMMFYYGKELFDAKDYLNASRWLMNSLKEEKLEANDRLSGMIFAAQAALQCQAYDQAIDLCLNGLKLSPQKAEFYVQLGDCYLAIQDVGTAIFYYKCALQCFLPNIGRFEVTMPQAYRCWPLRQLCMLHCQIGDISSAREYLKQLESISKSDFEQMKPMVENMSNLNQVKRGVIKKEDIIITCPPSPHMRPWDEETIKIKGEGGSETAVIEVSKHMTKLSGKRVIVFQNRPSPKVMKDSGVEYRSVMELPNYLEMFTPLANICWRHPTKLADCPHFVWTHDLMTMGADKQQYDKQFVLTPFHADYISQIQGISKDKMSFISNGLNPDEFKFDRDLKDPTKVIFSSSPDRGMDWAIEIVKLARQKSGIDFKLHLFYGFENMRKMGMSAKADSIEKLIRENADFVHYHGMVTKDELYKHFAEACIWLYPSNFIESFCITALEALASHCYPIVRRIGGVKDVLAPFVEKGQAMLLDSYPSDNFSLWAEALISTHNESLWSKLKGIEPSDFSWENVARKMLEEMNVSTVRGNI